MAQKIVTVTAKANGYYGNKVRVPGETFALDDPSDFSDVWMEKGKDDANTERFVATGGTDGIVGTAVERKTKPTKRERAEMEKLGISDNDDRTDDFASNPADDVSPAADDGKDDDKK